MVENLNLNLNTAKMFNFEGKIYYFMKKGKVKLIEKCRLHETRLKKACAYKFGTNYKVCFLGVHLNTSI